MYLIRHAKSSWAEPGLGDFDRPLNHRGKADAPFMGQRLAGYGIRLDLIVASPAKRARKTARFIAEAVHVAEKSIVLDAALYMAEIPALLQTIAGVPDSLEDLALVGHNYGITDLAEWLTGRSIGNIPTCGIAAIEFDCPSWSDLREGSGRLLFFDYPKKHPGRK
nr:histidine phosphatase family protein [Desulfoprunum benzoelyticum]